MQLRTEERFGPVIADRVRGQLRQAVRRLAAFPGIGHRRSDLTQDPAYRFWLLGPTLIAYRQVASNHIEVILIERAERNWTRLLDEPDVDGD